MDVQSQPRVHAAPDPKDLRYTAIRRWPKLSAAAKFAWWYLCQISAHGRRLVDPDGEASYQAVAGYTDNKPDAGRKAVGVLKKLGAVKEAKGGFWEIADPLRFADELGLEEFLKVCKSDAQGVLFDKFDDVQESDGTPAPQSAHEARDDSADIRVYRGGPVGAAESPHPPASRPLRPTPGPNKREAESLPENYPDSFPEDFPPRARALPRPKNTNKKLPLPNVPNTSSDPSTRVDPRGSTASARRGGNLSGKSSGRSSTDGPVKTGDLLGNLLSATGHVTPEQMAESIEDEDQRATFLAKLFKRRIEAKDDPDVPEHRRGTMPYALCLHVAYGVVWDRVPWREIRTLWGQLDADKPRETRAQFANATFMRIRRQYGLD